jgi:hypothetical protein
MLKKDTWHLVLALHGIFDTISGAEKVGMDMRTNCTYASVVDLLEAKELLICTIEPKKNWNR